jgi:hypothetical protein
VEVFCNSVAWNSKIFSFLQPAYFTENQKMIRLPVRASTRCGSSLTPANNKRVKTTYIRYFSTAKGVIHLTDENWKQVVEEGSKKGPVVVDFKAEYVNQCA